MSATDWKAEASCRGKDPRPWFPVSPSGRSLDDHDLYAYARAVCAGCPVRKDCLDFALGIEAQGMKNEGMWGGLDEDERKKRRRRKVPNHGTNSGYKQHGRLGEVACAACAEAHNLSQQAWRASRAAS